MSFDANKVYKTLKGGLSKYNEETHCLMILKIMADPNKGTFSAFCVEAVIGDTTFYRWLDAHDLFLECYAYGRMVARENWEDAGKRLETLQTDEVGCSFELWRMKGWSNFGVGKNARIRLKLKAEDNPAQHYAQIMKQASEGDFTAGEIKQLMEAINVGLNAHQVFELQKEIDQLKSDLAKMIEIRNGENTYTNKGIT